MARRAAGAEHPRRECWRAPGGGDRRAVAGHAAPGREPLLRPAAAFRAGVRQSPAAVRCLAGTPAVRAIVGEGTHPPGAEPGGSARVVRVRRERMAAKGPRPLVLPPGVSWGVIGGV